MKAHGGGGGEGGATCNSFIMGGGGEGGNYPPMIFDLFVYLFFCLLTQWSVMSLIIIPLPHYDNILKNIWSEVGKKKKMCVGVPTAPPPPRYSD